MSATLTLTPSVAAALTAYRAAKALREEAGMAVQSYTGPDGRFEADVGRPFVMACEVEDKFARQLACIVSDAAPPSARLREPVLGLAARLDELVEDFGAGLQQAAAARSADP